MYLRVVFLVEDRGVIGSLQTFQQLLGLVHCLFLREVRYVIVNSGFDWNLGIIEFLEIKHPNVSKILT